MMVDKSVLHHLNNDEEKPKKVKIYQEITEKYENLFYVEKVIDWNKRLAGYP